MKICYSQFYHHNLRYLCSLLFKSEYREATALGHIGTGKDQTRHAVGQLQDIEIDD